MRQHHFVFCDHCASTRCPRAVATRVPTSANPLASRPTRSSSGSPSRRAHRLLEVMPGLLFSQSSKLKANTSGVRKCLRQQTAPSNKGMSVSHSLTSFFAEDTPRRLDCQAITKPSGADEPGAPAACRSSRHAMAGPEPSADLTPAQVGSTFHRGVDTQPGRSAEQPGWAAADATSGRTRFGFGRRLIGWYAKGIPAGEARRNGRFGPCQPAHPSKGAR